MKKTNLLSIYFLIISLLVQSLLAESFSTNPILKVEAGMHTAVIRRISTDKENRILATASTDKTAKLWDLSTGKLLRTIRVPIEHGHEGKVNAEQSGVAFRADRHRHPSRARHRGVSHDEVPICALASLAKEEVLDLARPAARSGRPNRSTGRGGVDGCRVFH